MGFLSGLALGLLAGAAAGSRYTPGGLREDLEDLWRMVPPDLRDAGEQVQTGIKERLNRAQAAYRAAAQETKQRLERELESAQTGRG
ncbi:MAG: hypothetical protein HY534_00110 [Chloroflexi bacterium]|nr:hypothetical protein [Chloroflexota bacterium]